MTLNNLFSVDNYLARSHVYNIPSFPSTQSNLINKSFLFVSFVFFVIICNYQEHKFFPQETYILVKRLTTLMKINYN